MFKRFIKMIIASQGKEDALETVFYGENGIDRAFQMGLLTWNEHEMLRELIEMLA